MLRLALLALVAVTVLGSDIARVYPNGTELAKGGQTGGKPYPNGTELAHTGNGNLAHDYKDDRTK